MSQQSPAKLHRAGQSPFDFRQSLLLAVYQQTSLHMVKDLRGTIRGTGLRIGTESQLDELPLHAGVLKSEGLWEQFSFLFAIFRRLFLLLPHLLRIIQHLLDALILDLALLGI